PVSERQPDPIPERKPTQTPEPQLQLAPAPQTRLGPKPAPKPVIAAPPKPESEPKPSRKSAPSQDAPKTRKLPSAASGSGARASKPSGKPKVSAKKKALESRYLREVQRAIARKRRYPQNARRRGEAGTAVVSFVVERGGTITDIRLAQSSGSTRLDAAALNTLKRLGRFKPIPQAIGRNRWPMRVPIRFALR
ncbi:MAG: energy transducer TonB, partial [Thiohalocapsa sp.]